MGYSSWVSLLHLCRLNRDQANPILMDHWTALFICSKSLQLTTFIVERGDYHCLLLQSCINTRREFKSTLGRNSSVCHCDGLNDERCALDWLTAHVIHFPNSHLWNIKLLLKSTERKCFYPIQAFWHLRLLYQQIWTSNLHQKTNKFRPINTADITGTWQIQIQYYEGLNWQTFSVTHGKKNCFR